MCWGEVSVRARGVYCTILAAFLLGMPVWNAARADPAFLADPFSADGSLADWGISLTTQSGADYSYGVTGNAAWTDADLKPHNLADDSYGYHAKDDDNPISHGGEGFDVEALWFAQDTHFFYFAMLTSVPPDGARDPYLGHQTKEYGGVTQRRRFFPGDIALSIVVPHPDNPYTQDNYEYGIAAAPPDPTRSSDYPYKHTGDVWRREPELDWIVPDDDRSADATTFANFKTSGAAPGVEVYSGAATGNTTTFAHDGTPGIASGHVFDTVEHSGSYDSVDPIYGSNLPVELYYGPAKDALPSGSFEGPGDGMGGGGAYYPNIWYNGGLKYLWGSSCSDIPIDTYVFEAKYPRALFLEGFAEDKFEDKYVMHWTMGCGNDALGFNILLEFEPLQPIHEPLSAAFAGSVFIGVVAFGVGRRMKRMRRWED